MSFELGGIDPATGEPITVVVDDGVVREIRAGTADDVPPDTYLTAGLIDLQVNGFGGFDVNAEDAGPEVVDGMVRALSAVGVTTVVPTVITASEQQIVAALRRIAAARAADPLVRHAIPYVHVEGPHLSDEDGPRGVHPAEQIRPPDIEEFRRWQTACDGLVGMVTLSPHWPDSTRYIAQVAGHGAHVAIGHTHASPEQVTAAIDAGATLGTHLGNGAHAVLPRHPNYIWTQLADDRLSAGFIADGHHLPADTLIAMLRAKGPNRAFLVSDAVALAGAAPGRYRTPVGGDVELSEAGRLSYRGTPFLAGAVRSLSDGVAHVAGIGPFSLGEAVWLASGSPGRFCGGRGTTRTGAAADLVRFRWMPGATGLDVERVVVAGVRQE